MPITQERMLSLLAAGEDYKQALERYWIIAQSTRQNVAAGRITPEQGFNLLAIETRPEFLLQFPYDSPAVIKLEHLHFKRESKRNLRKAEKARENRVETSAGRAKPDRGDGREFGILGGGRTRLERELNIKPEPGILLNSTSPTKPSPKSTDADQVQSDSDLDFGTGMEPEVKDSVNKFLEQQVEKERLQREYEDTVIHEVK